TVTIAMFSFLLGGDRQAHVAVRLPVCRDALFHDRAEVPDQALDRPGGGVAEGADGVALDLAADLVEHVDLGQLGAAFDHAAHDAHRPARAFAAGRALAAALVL